MPVTVYLHKADRKNRRARGEYIEQENEDEIILEEAIIFGNSLRR